MCACFRKGLGSGDASGRGRERGRWAWQAESRWYGQWTIGTSSVHLIRWEVVLLLIGGLLIHLRTCCIHNPFPFDIKGGSEGGKGSHHVCARRPYVMKGGWEEAKVGSGDGIATAAAN